MYSIGVLSSNSRLGDRLFAVADAEHGAIAASFVAFGHGWTLIGVLGVFWRRIIVFDRGSGV